LEEPGSTLSNRRGNRSLGNISADCMGQIRDNNVRDLRCRALSVASFGERFQPGRHAHLSKNDFRARKGQGQISIRKCALRQRRNDGTILLRESSFPRLSIEIFGHYSTIKLHYGVDSITSGPQGVATCNPTIFLQQSAGEMGNR
jgi:hypothetical protein